jgi:hypothetical protein
MKFKKLHSIFENLIIQRLLAKIVTNNLWVFASASFMALRILVFSLDFHQALYIFWTIIVVVNLILQVGPEIFDRPQKCLMDFLPLGRILFSTLLIGPAIDGRCQIKPEDNFFLFVVFLDKFMMYWTF